MAPTDAASVGVANPDKIEPKTAIISVNGGNRALRSKDIIYIIIFDFYFRG